MRQIVEHSQLLVLWAFLVLVFLLHLFSFLLFVCTTVFIPYSSCPES